MNREEQKRLLIEIMEADEKDGLYKTNNMAQQTAVEWLKDKLKETYDKEGKLPLAYTLHLVEQAKQMEKEQIIKSHNNAVVSPYTDLYVWQTQGKSQITKGEQYYDETYNR